MKTSNMKQSLHLWLDQHQNEKRKLYYILDSAADEQFPDQLEQLKDTEAISSLFVGTPQESLTDVAPYLIMLTSRESALFELLTNDAKNKNWGFFILSEQPFYELLKHCQSHLSAQLPNGENTYFRYYDPRVLLHFCQSSNQQAICELKGAENLWFIGTQNPASSLTVLSDGHYEIT